MIYLNAVLLAVVEGITEFLPVSSTAHLVLLEEFLLLSEDADFRNTFNFVIQLPAILSVLVYFWKDWWPFGCTGERRLEVYTLWTKILVAFVALSGGGYLVHEFSDVRL